MFYKVRSTWTALRKQLRSGLYFSITTFSDWAQFIYSFLKRDIRHAMARHWLFHFGWRQNLCYVLKLPLKLSAFLSGVAVSLTYRQFGCVLIFLAWFAFLVELPTLLRVLGRACDVWNSMTEDITTRPTRTKAIQQLVSPSVQPKANKVSFIQKPGFSNKMSVNK